MCKVFTERCNTIWYILLFLFRLASKKCCQESGTPNLELSSFLEDIREAPLPMALGDRREIGSFRPSMCLKTPEDPSLICLSEWVTVHVISLRRHASSPDVERLGVRQHFLCREKLGLNTKNYDKPYAYLFFSKYLLMPGKREEGAQRNISYNHHEATSLSILVFSIKQTQQVKTPLLSPI